MKINKLLNNRTLPLFSFIIFYGTLFIALIVRGLNYIDYTELILYGLQYLPSFIIFMMTLYLFNIFDVFNINLNNKDLKSISYSVLVYAIFNILYFYLFPSDISPKTILIIHGIILYILFSLFFLYYKRNILNKKKINAIMISNRKESIELIRMIAKSKSNINFALHFMSDDLSNNDEIENLYKLISTHKINAVVIDFDNTNNKEILNKIYHHYYDNIKVYSLDDLYEIVFKKIIYDDIDYSWYYRSASINSLLYDFVKRVIDILLTMPVLLILAIIHPMIYYRIKQEMKKGLMNPGSIFYKHKRIGRNCKPIIVHQYRSMQYADKVQAWHGERRDIDGNISENKVTPFGTFLRRTRIDALPQVWNVLKGEQSFIGPRPDAEGLYYRLEKEIPYYNLRYSVTPGLSGWAQTNQSSVPHSIEENRERFAFDLFYIKNKSIILDIIIILKTIRTLLMRAGK